MNYKEFKKNLRDLTLKYQREREKVNDMIKNVQNEHERGIISDHEEKEQEKKLYGILDTLKSKEKRSVERLKMNFAMQDNPVEIGDIIWAQSKNGTKVMKVTEIRLAAFEYPMLKYFGIQLTLKGMPAKTQKQYPSGGIYQKDVVSVKGEAYTYKVRD